MSARKVEQTLGMIKPDAVHKVDEIESEILAAGFTILQKRIRHLTKDEAETFYEEHQGKPFYDPLVEYMASGEVVAMILSREDAIAEWRHLLGPTKVSVAVSEAPNSIRAKYGDRNNDSHNAAHGSDSLDSAQREIKFFFPELTLEPVLNGGGAKEYLTYAVSPTLVLGLSELCKFRPEDPIKWLADWLLLNNPNQHTLQK